MAPEAKRGGACAASDIYSLGCTIIRLMAVGYPHALSVSELIVDEQFWEESARVFSKELRGLVNDMCSEEHGARPTARDVENQCTRRHWRRVAEVRRIPQLTAGV